MAKSKRVLLDHCVPKPLKHELPSHVVQHASEIGWQNLDDRPLLEHADGNYDVLVTIDQNIPYQQNLSLYKIALIILVARSNRLEALQPLVTKLTAALDTIQPGDVVKIAMYKIT